MTTLILNYYVDTNVWGVNSGQRSGFELDLSVSGYNGSGYNGFEYLTIWFGSVLRIIEPLRFGFIYYGFYSGWVIIGSVLNRFES